MRVSIAALILSLVMAGAALAQDDLDALLQDLSSTEETAPAAEATPIEAAPAAAPIEAHVETPAVAPELEGITEAGESVAEIEEAVGTSAEPTEIVETVAEPVESVQSEADAAVDALLEEVPAAAEQAADTLEQIPSDADALLQDVEIAPEEAPVAEAPSEVVAEPAVEPVVEAATEPATTDDLLSDIAEPAPVPLEEAVAAPAEETLAPVEDVGEHVAPAAEAAVAAPAEPATEPTEDAMPEGMDPKIFAQQEEARRQLRDKEGRKNLEEGLAALRAGRLSEAVQKLQDAQAKIPNRPATANLIKSARQALGEAHTKQAEEALRAGDLKAARQSLNAAKTYTAPTALEEIDHKLSRGEERAAREAAKPVPVVKRPEMVEKEKSIKELLAEGRQFLEAGDYNAAEILFEKVLLKDEYNIDAMRFLRKLDQKRYEARSKEREATEAEMIQKVRDTWNPPLREDAQLPQAAQNRGAVETKTSAQKLQEKMEQIIIPSIEFRQANITDVVNFLVEASIQGDKVDQTGVNIILNLGMPGGEATPAPMPVSAPAPATGDFGSDFGGEFGGDFGDASAPAPALSAPTAGIPSITMNLRRITLLDAIKYITEVARLKFRLEENAVIITPEGVVSGRVITRLYPVQPSIIDVVVEKDAAPERSGDFVEMGSTRSSIKKSDVKEFFEKAGVPFPAGTSITYNPTISQLIVANTPENLETFERILSRLNVIPNQVEIEARFVEIAQDDLEELGFQWILTDNWEIAQKQGIGAIAGQEQVIAQADPDGFSKGLRFFNANQNAGAYGVPLSAPVSAATGSTPLGGILSFASVLTNPEVKLVIQALSQHGGTDLLSAPRVTTRSGVNAQIQVVQEIIYPTEFESEVVTIDREQVGGGTIQDRVVTVTPGTFETRETGVILNVTPTVGPDGYTIDLTLVPEVAELVDWIQYGSQVGTDENGNPIGYNIPQPIFASRNVTTSIVIWDGQTVVMGGLIREDLVKVKDKIPMLGDIPWLGRLFRSEGEFSRKKNLLIFVTARLVDPSGKPIHRTDAPGGSDAAAGAEQVAPKS